MNGRFLREMVALWKGCDEEDFLDEHRDPFLVGLGEVDAGLIRSTGDAVSTWIVAIPQGGGSEPRAGSAHEGEVIPVVGKSGPEQVAILLGRSPFCDIALEDPAISELHCQLERAGEGFVVNDQGSTNGTMINGRPLEPGVPGPLENDDVLTVGRLSFKFFTPRVLFQLIRLGLVDG